MIAQEHQIVWLGLLRIEAITLHIKLLELGRIVDALLDHEAAHHAPGLFRVEADDFVLAVLQVLELGVDDARVQGRAFDCREVLVGGQVKQHVIALLGECFVEPLADAGAPEGIEVLAAGIGQLGAHLEAVRHHQVQRAQQAVEAGEHAQVVLGVAEIGVAEGFGVEAGVDVTLERQQGLLGIFRREGGCPAAKERGVEATDLVGHVHQFADLGGAQFTQLFDQLLGVVEVLRLGEARGDRLGLEVEGFGGGNHHQHEVGSCNRGGILGGHAV